jgi:hypothetical protein
VKSESATKPMFIPNADGAGGSRLKMHGKVVTPAPPALHRRASVRDAETTSS